MTVLILGSGAREHALAWLFSKSSRVSKIHSAPGNAGMAGLGSCHPDVDPNAGKAVVALALNIGADLVFVGPEAPAAAGTVDALQAAGVPVIGPNRASARLESSKLFSKRFFVDHGIPTAEAVEFDSFDRFERYIDSRSGKKLVIKKNGLAAGKGVLESSDRAELLAFGKSVFKNDALLVEEFLTGWETSIFALCDGVNYRGLLPTTDHKKAHDDDKGPNTGGMGAICPVPRVDEALAQRIESELVAPTFSGLQKEGLAYKGVVYFGIMVTAEGPKMLEYNVRFGDPEAQVLLPLIKTDFGEIAQAMSEGTLDKLDIRFHDKSALGVVVAAEGYPEGYEKNLPVEPIDQPPEDEAVIFHASTTLSASAGVKTGGGRCFTVTGFGKDLKAAAEAAYKHINRVRFPGAWYRKDIGRKFY
ncbi:MAG: phosphoribosylamine--glycine ligase [Spirochaetales bacterium]|nr:phosphoribosylamine--glycine ligase [Spirochaetales bacterium]